MIVGVLALQGDFFEHCRMFERLEVGVREVRLPEQLDGLDGLVIPGGESTTIGKMAQDFGIIEPLRAFGKSKAIWGTCAGAILLSKDAHRTQPLLGLMDITILRNAFGRQVDSFETQIDMPCLSLNGSQSTPFHAVFIRAPIIESVTGNARILAQLADKKIVAAQQGRLLATSFHPELTGDDRVHRYFLKLIND